MKFSKEYLNLYLVARKSLNTDNFEKLSAKQIEHLSKMYNNELFEDYKKYVFFKWLSLNDEISTSFNNKAKRLVKKYKLQLNEFELEKIDNLEPREFALTRSMKTIEAPYGILPEADGLNSFYIFSHKNTRVYKESYPYLRKMFTTELYISLNEMVMYDRKTNNIDMVIPFRTVSKIVLKRQGVEVTFGKDKDKIFFREKDNQELFISLRRIAQRYNSIMILENDISKFDNFEKTIETFLE